MLPLLLYLADGREVRMSQVVDALGRQMSLTDDELRTMLPSGASTTFGSRVGWAKTYLKQAGLVEQPKRGVVRMTPRGLEVLSGRPDRVDNELLSRLPEFQSFRVRSRQDRENVSAHPARIIEAQTPTQSPYERLEDASKELGATLAEELLAAIQTCSPPVL